MSKRSTRKKERNMSSAAAANSAVRAPAAIPLGRGLESVLHFFLFFFQTRPRCKADPSHLQAIFLRIRERRRGFKALRAARGVLSSRGQTRERRFFSMTLGGRGTGGPAGFNHPLQLNRHRKDREGSAATFFHFSRRGALALKKQTTSSPLPSSLPVLFCPQAYWRIAGMSYLKYANMCAEVVRTSLKEPFLLKVRRSHVCSRV